MPNSNIYLRGDDISRPNVLIAYTAEQSAAASELAALLAREDINVLSPDSGRGSFADLHLAILRDGGINDPAFDLIGQIRRSSDIPIMTVSDGCGEIYRTMALAKGADICMDSGDFGRFEFKARVVSLLRRYLSTLEANAPAPDKKASATTGGSAKTNAEPVKGGSGTAGGCSSTAEMMINGSISVNRRRREVFRSGKLVRLTTIEYGIVEYLMENCGDVCTVDDIYRRVWNENPYSVRKTVVEHIRRIRSKIEPDPHNPSYIKVVFGIGYKMEKAV